MEINESKNYWAIEFVNADETKWLDILDYILPMATHVEFNILYSNQNLKDFLIDFNNSISREEGNKNKMYYTGNVLRLELSKKVIDFLKHKKYSDFKNFFLEDPSFYINDKEVIASISHEDQIYLNSMYVDLNHFNHFKLQHKLFENKEIGLWEKIRNLFK